MRAQLCIIAAIVSFNSFCQELDVSILETVNITFDKQTQISQNEVITYPINNLNKLQIRLNVIPITVEKHLQPHLVKATATLTTNRDSAVPSEDLPVIYIISESSNGQSPKKATARLAYN